MIAVNPLTYGVAALRRLMYLGVDPSPLPEGTPSLALAWLVTLGFAVVMFALAWQTAQRRTTGDLL